MGKIEKLILGTAQFGLNYGINNMKGKPRESEIEQILIKAYDSGLRTMDTAEAYGNAHDIIGQFHRKNPGRRFNIITKIPHKFAGDLKSRIEQYLTDLEVDKLESILFHSYDTYLELKASFEDLIYCKEEGLLESIGVSVYTNSQMEDVMQDKLIDIIQLPYNLLDNFNIRGKFLQKAKDHGKIIHTRSAYLQGLFFMGPSNTNKTYESLQKQLIILQHIAEDHGINMQRLALNYCLQQPLIDSVLIGVDNLDQLQQNLTDATYDLQADIISDINAISVQNTDLLNPSLWN